MGFQVAGISGEHGTRPFPAVRTVAYACVDGWTFDLVGYRAAEAGSCCWGHFGKGVVDLGKEILILVPFVLGSVVGFFIARSSVLVLVRADQVCQGVGCQLMLLGHSVSM